MVLLVARDATGSIPNLSSLSFSQSVIFNIGRYPWKGFSFESHLRLSLHSSINLILSLFLEYRTLTVLEPRKTK